MFPKGNEPPVERQLANPEKSIQERRIKTFTAQESVERDGGILLHIPNSAEG